ncbi:Ig-like domain-containing protein [Iamia majanohamensis]|uniref:Ig-like domain-containing protein n=1 Tax=Iamia majanohamensis TaxID=467976 RepID=A0AAF0BXB8_9ACTN|nr:Ig-like domain-containing protein [Iamia majanohamensis]WCO68544.1 Ig-like domain-containing protein [Iamia majanohamensis]
MRKVIGAAAAVVLAVLASLTVSQVAGAQYDPEACTVTVSPASVEAGGTVTLSGETSSSVGGTAGQPVSFSIDGEALAETTTGDDGTFSVEATIPAGLAPGTYTITAQCGGAGGEVLGTTDVQVLAAGGGGAGGDGTGGTGTGAGGTGSGAGGTGSGAGGTGSGGQSGGDLARTGTDLGLPVQVGVALLALGGIALALTTSRRRAA